MFTIKEIEDNIAQLKSGYLVKHRVTEKDLSHFPRASIGDIIFSQPQPTNTTQAWDMLVYNSALICEQEKLHFLQVGENLKDPPAAAKIKAAVSMLDKDITIYKQQNEAEADALYGTMNDIPAAVYKRLETGFYQRLRLERYPGVGTNGSIAYEAKIYGKYFLFYEFLKELLDNKLSIPQTAIVCQALGIFITKANAPELLKKYSSFKSVDVLVREAINIKKDAEPKKLVSLSENKSADTKHENNLKAALAYVTLHNEKDAIEVISNWLHIFQKKFNEFYS